jgi:hypothetical protein
VVHTPLHGTTLDAPPVAPTKPTPALEVSTAPAGAAVIHEKLVTATVPATEQPASVSNAPAAAVIAIKSEQSPYDMFAFVDEPDGRTGDTPPASVPSQMPAATQADAPSTLAVTATNAAVAAATSTAATTERQSKPRVKRGRGRWRDTIVVGVDNTIVIDASPPRATDATDVGLDNGGFPVLKRVRKRNKFNLM